MTIRYNDIYSKSRRHWSTSGLNVGQVPASVAELQYIELQSSYRSAFWTIPGIEISIAPHSTRSAAKNARTIQRSKMPGSSDAAWLWRSLGPWHRSSLVNSLFVESRRLWKPLELVATQEKTSKNFLCWDQSEVQVLTFHSHLHACTVQVYNWHRFVAIQGLDAKWQLQTLVACWGEGLQFEEASQGNL